MYCRQCGQPVAPNAYACASCQAPIANPYQAATGMAAAPAMPSGDKPYNYLVPGIFAALCCCIPGGIVSIIYATQVDSKWTVGDVAGAQQAARSAKLWFWVSIGVGGIIGLLSFGLQIAVGIQQANGRF